MLSTRMTADEEEEVLKELQAIQEELVSDALADLWWRLQFQAGTKRQTSKCTRNYTGVCQG